MSFVRPWRSARHVIHEAIYSSGALGALALTDAMPFSIAAFDE